MRIEAAMCFACAGVSLTATASSVISGLLSSA
jgi:hypothetical protein